MRRTRFPEPGRLHAPAVPRGAPGVTLIELVVVIAITGIIAAAVAVFVARPVEGYLETSRRAEMTDIADSALRRIARELRTALPNSVRVATSGNVTYLEFLETSGGGRYRAEVDSGGAGDILDFTTADSSFDVIGPMPAFSGGEAIVVYNLNSDPAVPTANAYAGDNRAAYGSNTATTITLAAAKKFPFASPGNRFQVVRHPVTYACDPLPAGSGQLRRHWGYPISLAQPTPPVGGSSALLASNITQCEFKYATGGATGRTGVVALHIEITQAGQSVRLFQQVHVSNVP
jgi:MSHA biogenesis protein MshO